MCKNFLELFRTGATALVLATGGGCDSHGVRGPARDSFDGRWVRPDGGYVLEIADASEAPGVSYFNPGSIHVETARFEPTTEEGEELVIVLQDRGYPGAIYRLRHNWEADQLVGTYWQPASGQTFNVRFVRRD